MFPVSLPRLFFFCALVLSGLVLNYFRFHVFFNIDFVFGGIAALFALQFFSLRTATFAAALISAYTYFLWNHPYAILIMTLEVAIVGAIYTRYNLNLIIADAIYWLFFGMPLVYFLYGIIMHADQSVFLTMIKQAMNGLFNALLSRILFTGWVFIARRDNISFRELLNNTLAFFVLIPSLVMLSIDSRLDFAKTEDGIKESLAQTYSHFSMHLQQWLLNRERALAGIALSGQGFQSGMLQPRLDSLLSIDRNFVAAIFNDEAGTSLSTGHPSLIPTLQEFAASKSNIAEFIYSKQPVALTQIPDRNSSEISGIAITAMLSGKTEHRGYILAVINVLNLKPILESGLSSERKFILLDQTGKILCSNYPALVPMQQFSRNPGKFQTSENGVTKWVPVPVPNRPKSERWKRSLYVLESELDTPQGWKLIIEEPVCTVMQSLFTEYSEKFSLLFLILLFALVCAELLSTRLVSTIEDLCHVTNDLVNRVANFPDNLIWPKPSRILEATELTNNFKEMADELGAQFRLSRQHNLLLEQQVEEQSGSLEYNKNIFQTLISYAPVGIFLFNLKGEVLLVNNKWCELSGLTHEQAMNDGWFTILHPDDKEKVLKYWFDGVLKGNDLLNLEFRYVTPQGSTNWIYGIAKKIDHPDQEKIIYLGCVVDMTERKQFISAQHESLTNFRNLFESITDLIIVLSPDGHLIFSNRAFREKLAYSGEELAFLHLRDLIAENVDLEIDSLLSELNFDLQASHSMMIHTRTKQLVPVDAQFWRGSWNGLECIFGFLKDMTEHNEARYRFEKLFNKNPALMALMSVPDYHFVDINEATLKTLGYTREEIIGKTTEDLHLDVDDAQRKTAALLLEASGSISEFEVQYRCKDGRIIHGLLSGERISSHLRDYYLFVMIDITERKLAEDALRTAKDQAIAADASKTKLLLTVAHEFRTPLTLLTSSIDILDRYSDRINEQERKNQELHIRNASQQLKSLVSSVLTFNQIESQKQDIEFASVDIGHLCRQIAEEVQQSLSNGQIFSLSIGPNLQAMLTNATFIRRILENVLSNAFQYTRAGNKISFSAQRIDDHLSINISDEGIGISEEDQIHIFESFYRGQNVRGRRGVGLGLGIVKEAVERLGGNLTLESSLEQGTAISINIPWKTAAS